MSNRCFLFDLDGTLVLTGGAGLRAFDLAFKEVFKRDGTIQTVSPAGKTDPKILDEVCQLSLGRNPTPEEEEKVFARYLYYLREEIQRADKFRVLPGIEPLLEKLSQDKRCLLGLGTGNIKEGARVKLERPNLWRYFPFGGFGSDSRERPRLLEIALDRSKEFLEDGKVFNEVYVIGDTPKDIQSGRALGAQTIGVATGSYTIKELRESGAHRVYPDLSDYNTFLKDLGLI